MGRMKDYCADLECEPEQEFCDCESCQEAARAEYEEIEFETKKALGYL